MPNRKSKKLTHTFVQHVSEPGRYGEGRGGNGLSLLVKPMQEPGRWSKTWSQRLRIDGQEYTPGLGSFPKVSLAKARAVALDNALRVAEGVDIRKPALEITLEISPTIPTVAQAFEAVIDKRSKKWRSTKTKEGWDRSLRYCKGISSMLVSEVKPSQVVDLIEPLWNEQRRTAQIVLSHLTSVMDWAVRMEHRSTNPAGPGTTTDLGPKAAVTGMLCLNHRLLGDALATVRDAETWWANILCVIFMAFTGVRSGEARKATWDEFDLDNALWTIPAERMKNGILHKVPLSTQVVEILAYARKQSDPSENRAFPTSGRGKHIPSAALSNLLKDLLIASVPHGLRKSLRTWAAEQENPPILEHAAEMLLAHKPKKSIVAIYMTSDFYEHRQPVMQRWADYLTSTMGPVIPTTPQVSKPRGKSENLSVQTLMTDPTSEVEYAILQEQIPPDCPQNLSPIMQNWTDFLAQTVVPVTPGVPA